MADATLSFDMIREMAQQGTLPETANLKRKDGETTTVRFVNYIRGEGAVFSFEMEEIPSVSSTT